MVGGGRALPAERVSLAARYILGLRRPDRLWEWDPAHGVPADADTTACSLAALSLAGEPLDGAAEAARLRSFWREPDGPFRTWEGSSWWQDPARDDPVVNCNVVLALGLLGVPATASEIKAVETIVRERGAIARYYVDHPMVAYAARRAGIAIDHLPEVATARPPADKLMSVLPWLCATGSRDPDLIRAVLDAQRPDGAWPIRVWISGAGSRTPQWGSPAITTALALEALQAVEEGA